MVHCLANQAVILYIRILIFSTENISIYMNATKRTKNAAKYSPICISLCICEFSPSRHHDGRMVYHDRDLSKLPYRIMRFSALAPKESEVDAGFPLNQGKETVSDRSKYINTCSHVRSLFSQLSISFFHTRACFIT